MTDPVMHMANSSAQITPVSMKSTWHGMVVPKVINHCMYMHVPLQMQQGECGVLFLTQPWPDADLQFALLVPEDPWIHGFPWENPTVMCFLSEKGVWGKGNQSNYLALTLIFYPQPADRL